MLPQLSEKGDVTKLFISIVNRIELLACESGG